MRELPEGLSHREQPELLERPTTFKDGRIEVTTRTVADGMPQPGVEMPASIHFALQALESANIASAQSRGLPAAATLGERA